MKIYEITVEQIAPQLFDNADKMENPAGQYSFWGRDETDALDNFHSTVPIGCLEDFNITIVERIY